MLTLGTFNPNGIVSGNTNWTFLDITTATLYGQMSFPMGNNWKIIKQPYYIDFTPSPVPSGGGNLNPKGDWDASLNSPTLVSSVGTLGDIYRVSVGGSTLLDGNNVWAVNDDVLFANGIWNRIVGGITTYTLTVGLSTIAAGVNGRVLYDNAGILGELVAGDLTESVSDVLNITGNGALLKDAAIEVQKADATHDGYLSDTDYNYFAAKIDPVLTKKADLLTFAAGMNIRLPVGQDNYQLAPDSTLVRGVRWQNPTPRTQTVLGAGAVTATFNLATNNEMHIPELSGTLTLANPSGTPFDGQQLRILIKACASVQTIIYAGGKWAQLGTTLLNATVPNFDTDIYALYNLNDDKYYIVGVVFTPNQFTATIAPRVTSGSIIPDFQADDGVSAYNMSNMVISNWTGTPFQDCKKYITIRDTGSTATIIYGNKYRVQPGSSVAFLPPTTVAGKLRIYFCSWNDLDNMIDVYAINNEA